MIDRAQVETTIAEARTALDAINSHMETREAIFQTLLSSSFLAFAAATQLLKKSPREQLGYLNVGLDTVGRVLALQGGAARYGKGRSCGDVTEEMARRACEIAKKEIDELRFSLRRGANLDGILSQRLMQFAIASRLLIPDGAAQARMMSNANEQVAQVIASGWLTRNEIKIGGG